SQQDCLYIAHDSIQRDVVDNSLGQSRSSSIVANDGQSVSKRSRKWCRLRYKMFEGERLPHARNREHRWPFALDTVRDPDAVFCRAVADFALHGANCTAERLKSLRGHLAYIACGLSFVSV